MEELLTRDFSTVPSLIWEIIIDPASRPVEAMLVFGIVVVLLAMLLLLTLLFVLKRADKDETDVDAETREVPTEVDPESAFVQHGDSIGPTVRKRRSSTGVIIAVAVVAWWLATGVTTAIPSVCLSCHADSGHALSQASRDPHEATSCVRCHEGGGLIAGFTTGVPQRVAHIASVLLSDTPAGTYGYVGSRSCTACHGEDLAQTTTSEAKAVRMSHREPLDAGAECLDCHRPRDGVVGTSTTKMQPCLRCHNDVDVSAECSYCHAGDISLAVSGRSEPSTATAQALVSDPQCGGCHSQETCDACHGIRLPHSPEFKAYAHAREGVQDIWNNGGKTCGKCHYSGNTPCTACHKGAFPSHGTGFRLRHGASGATGAGCDSCHGEMAYRNGRDFCVDLCHSEPLE